MCGILGYKKTEHTYPSDLVNVLNHRGPDSFGEYHTDTCYLGHTRLSILDLSELGSQPMVSSCKKYVITFNGEIYNHDSLKEELLDLGYTFKSTSDTEVLLYALIKWGKDVIQRLDGQFAFAFYDLSKHTLLLARDRVGINPLYYMHDETDFLFSSELKVMMRSGLSLTLDREVLDYYLHFGYMPRGQSIFTQVRTLLPGHMLELDLSTHTKKITRYWEYDPSVKTPRTLQQATDQLRGLLHKSVKSRLMSDVPVGAFLSGGLDSSTVVAIMSEYSTNINTYTVKFDYADYDESAYAKLVSDKFGTNHHVMEFSGEDVLKLIERLPEIYDEPFADDSLLPMYLVSKRAREDVTVCLSGDGADELFGGYNKYKLNNQLRYVPAFASRLVLFKSLKFRYLKEYLRLQPFERFAALCTFRYLQNINFRANKKLVKGYQEVFDNYDFYAAMLKCDIENYLPQDILVKVDRACLSNSLESRPPLLSNDLLDFSESLQSDITFPNGGKKVLRNVMRDILPAEVLDRSKKGFGSPIAHYFKNDLRDEVAKWLSESLANPYLDKKYVEFLIQKHCGHKDYSNQIFSVIQFNKWYEYWKESFQ